MIYSDDRAHSDDLEYPGKRNEQCINCGESWDDHSGWSCDARSGSESFHEIDPSRRYLTKNMVNSVKKEKTSVCTETAGTTNFHPSDWRAWMRNSNECPCGIARIMCTYHEIGEGK